MKKNKFFMAAALCLIAVAMGFCFMADRAAYLADPVWMRTYGVYELNYDEQRGTDYFAQVSFRFLTDWQDKRKPVSVEAMEAPYQCRIIPMSLANMNFQNGEMGQVYGRYRLQDIALEILVPKEDVDTNSILNVPFTKCTIAFDDGTTMEAALGQLYFIPYQSQADALNMDSSSASSDGSSSVTMYAEEDLILKRVEIAHAEEWGSDWLSMTVNGIPYEEVKDLAVSKGGVLRIETQCDAGESIVSQLDSIDLLPVLHFENASHEELKAAVHNISRLKAIYNLDFKKLYQYAKERGN